jgi:zinc/manganese transport system substrate-binding protein
VGRIFIFSVLLFLSLVSVAQNRLKLVAAENVYAQIASEIGGQYLEITSILNNPNQDPHLFTASPSVVRNIAHADIIVYNGLGYDAWMLSLLNAKRKQIVLIVADLVDKHPGDNPHIWYAPNTLIIYAQKLTDILIQKDPVHKKYYQARLAQFSQDYQTFLTQVNDLKNHYAGVHVLATEPFFEYMAQALDMRMYAQAFQISIMNGVEPSLKQIMEFESAINQHEIKLLFYNQQVSNPLTHRMVRLAKEKGIFVIGLTELPPNNIAYLTWMQAQLNQVQQALHEQSH